MHTHHQAATTVGQQSCSTAPSIPLSHSSPPGSPGRGSDRTQQAVAVPNRAAGVPNSGPVHPTARPRWARLGVADHPTVQLRAVIATITGPGAVGWPGYGEGSLFETPQAPPPRRSEEHTSELQSRENLVCRLLLEKKKKKKK